MGGLFAGLASESGGKGYQGAISNSLAETFDKASTHLENTFRIATVIPNIQRKVASEILKASGAKLVADPHIKSADDCRGPGFQWLQAGPESYYF